MGKPERETQRQPKTERWVMLGILALILLLFALFLKDIMLPLIRMELRRDFDGARALLSARGVQGALTVVLVEALQMVVVFVPAEFIQISSGLSYPFPAALLLCDLGVCLGATVIFALVRVFRFQSSAYARRRRTIDRLSAAVHERNTVLLLYLLFFMPIIPFGAICYYGSSTRLPYGKYIRTVATGVIPSIVVSNLMGAAGMAFLRESLPLWLLVCVIAALALALFVLIFVVIRRFVFRGAEETPDSMMYALIFFIVRLWQRRRCRVELDEALLAEAEAPYILLSNHQSFFDFYYISQLSHPRNPSFLVNAFYCTRPVLRRMAKPGGILSKKLFTPDLASAAGLLRMTRKGYPVVIFPEGRLSPDGRSNPIVERGGAFYKKLGVDLVLVKISGAYWADPKWRRRSFRCRVRVRVERVLKRDELAEMEPEALDELIEKTLWSDASDDAVDRYPQRDKAVGLENILYRCADCGALYTTKGEGNSLTCTACGASHTLDERYRFTGGIESISAYYDRIRELERAELDAFSLSAEVETKVFGSDGRVVRKERGVCTLTPEGFAYRSAAEDFTIPTEQLPALCFSCGKEFELYRDGLLHYFYPLSQPRQVARWALLVDLLAEKRFQPACPAAAGRPHADPDAQPDGKNCEIS